LTNYTITATNSAGSTQKIISIKVNAIVTTTLSLQSYINGSNVVIITFSEPVKLSANVQSKVTTNFFTDYFSTFDDGNNFSTLVGETDLDPNDSVFGIMIEFLDTSESFFINRSSFNTQIMLRPITDKAGSNLTLLEGVTFSLLEGFGVTADGRLTGAASISNVKVLDENF
jgi:hypothetical protein